MRSDGPARSHPSYTLPPPQSPVGLNFLKGTKIADPQRISLQRQLSRSTQRAIRTDEYIIILYTKIIPSNPVCHFQVEIIFHSCKPRIHTREIQVILSIVYFLG